MKVHHLQLMQQVRESYTVKNTDHNGQKIDKSLGNFENKQPNCTIVFILVFELSFIDCILSKIVGFDQLWMAVR